MSKGKVMAEILRLTPDLAGQWLNGQIKNRSISDKWVEELARRIRTGQWKYDGETIKFSKSGKMLDGQHRCWAVISAGITIKTLVAYDIEETAFDVIDSGRRRTLPDSLGLHDNNVNSTKQLAAITNIAWLYDNDFLIRRTRYPSTVEAMDYYRSNPAIRESYDFCRHGNRCLSVVRGGALHFLCSRANRDLADRFILRVNDGEGLLENNPIQVFRDKLVELLASREGAAVRYSQIAYGILAFNLLQNGKNTSGLVWKKGLFPRVENERILKQREIA